MEAKARGRRLGDGGGEGGPDSVTKKGFLGPPPGRE